MSNAKYRSVDDKPGQPASPVPTTGELLDHAKRVLFRSISKAEKSLDADDGQYTKRDCEIIVRQILEISKLEGRAMDRHLRQMREEQKAAKGTVPASGPAASGTVHTRPENAQPPGQSPSPEPSTVNFVNSLPRADAPASRAAG